MEYIILVVELIALIVLFAWQRKIYVKAESIASEKINQTLANFDSLAVPGWGTPMEQLDRLIEPHFDSIRNSSNQALVLGIGGTMLLFCFDAFIIFQLLSDDLPEPAGWTILVGLLLPLLSSLVGVSVHLLIVSRVFPLMEKSVDNKLKNLSQNANVHISESILIDWKKPEINFVQAVQKFLKGQQVVVTEMKKHFDKEESSTKQILQSQNILETMLTDLKSAAEQIYQATGCVHKVMESIDELPERFWKTMKEASSDWASEMEMNQERFSQKIDEFVDDMKKRATVQDGIVSDWNDLGKNLNQFITELEKMKSLPGDIKESFTSADQILTTEAKNYVSNMSAASENLLETFSKKVSEDQDRLRTILTNQVGDIVNEIFDPLSNRIDSQIVKPLNTLGQKLDSVTEEIPGAASTFGNKLKESLETLSEIPHKLDSVTKNINTITEETMKGKMKPFADKMEQFVETVEDTHERLDKMIQGLVHLIENLVKEMESRES